MVADDSSDEVATQLQVLLAWFKEKGGFLNRHVEIVHDRVDGLHMRVMDTLDAPFDIVTCPLSLSLSHLNLDPNQSWVPHVESPLQRCRGKVPDHVLTYLLLVEQLVWEGNSPWHPYIACLPDVGDPTSALWFDSKYFKGTPLPAAKREKLSLLEREHQDALLAMREAGLSGSETYEECEDFKSFLWAATIMSSRSFTSANALPEIPSFPILFPVLDIANHSVKSRVNWRYSEDRAFTLESRSRAQIRDQIFNNYGPKQNAELLLGYGFALRDNPVEQAIVTPQFPVYTSLQLDEKHIPWGLGRAALEDHTGGLRLPDNILGRYHCHIPFFQGFPPFIVFAAYTQALRARGMKPEETPASLASGRLVFATLFFLYRAVLQKCKKLPYSARTPVFSSVTSEYAYIYRNGQAKIFLSIRRELEAVLADARLPYSLSTHRDKAGAVSLTHVVDILKVEHPTIYALYRNWANYSFPIRDEPDEEFYARLRLPGSQETIWVLLMVCFRVIQLRELPYNTQFSIIQRWTTDLDSMYPYDPDHRRYAIGEEYQETFLQLERNLDTLAIHSSPDSMPAWLQRHPDKRRSCFEWALKVVSCEIFYFDDDDDDLLLRGSIHPRAMMYMPWPADGSGRSETWMFKEPEP